MGRQENHNACIIIIAVFALIFAFPYFSHQINNVQVQINSIESDLEELYRRNVVEEFSFEYLSNFEFRAMETMNQLKIILKDEPIKNSVMLWFGDQLTNPTNYHVEGKTINLDMTRIIDMEYMKNR